jgi:crotonobetainyl-CoA:carnitine CoA-transferase CaiB-like acyl-CoA transferase
MTSTEQVAARPISLLDGVKVLAFTHWLQGPAACQYLADLGADVVKVEPLTGSAERTVMGPGPGPGNASALFVAGNRNTRSVAVDLKSPSGREVVHELAQVYDVVVENYRPGVLDKLGVGYESLRAGNPALIFASATGYGPQGPLVSLPGQDLLAQSLSGFTAAAGHRPTPAGAAVIDQHGATLLALSVLAAVVQRSRTGQGCKIEASLLNAALDLQMEALTFYLNSGRPWSEAGHRDTNLGTWYHQAPYGVYEVADGWISISITPLATLSRALPEMGEIASLHPMRDRDEIARRVAAVLAPLSAAEAQRRLGEAGIWHAPVLDYDEVFDSEQVKANGIIGQVDGADWNASVVRHPVMYDGALPAVRSAPPRLGEHTRDVLLEIGLPGERVDTLIREGAVCCE